MTSLRVLVFAIVLLAMGGILASLNGCGGTSRTTVPPPPPGKIQHVVVIFQENRTPDNLFQGLCAANGGVPGCGTGPGQYDLAQSGTDSTGKTVLLQEVNLGTTYDPNHSHGAFQAMCDLNTTVNPPQCRMDGADKITVICPTGMTECTFAYVNPADVQPYLQLAEQYTFADRMFQTNQGPSFPAHQFIISGTSAPCSAQFPCPGAGSNLFAAENPKTGGLQPDAGCDAPLGSTVRLIDPAGSEDSNPAIYPCFEHPTLTDLLEAKGNTWRYYTSSGYPGGSGAGLWIGPEAIQHICGSTSSGVCGGTDWTNHVILNQAQILTDITNQQLPQVSWVIPTGQASDHSGDVNNTQGPSWVASVVNAIGNSSYWANTAIFITWDDWGGWFDHVAPPQVLVNCAQWGCGYVYGFRVPLIVVSPYAKAKYISKNQHDFGSILKFIEGIFGLPSLGYADAAADDLSDCFDFNQTPLPFQTIPSALNAQFFLNDKTPPTDPDDD